MKKKIYVLALVIRNKCTVQLGYVFTFFSRKPINIQDFEMVQSKI